MLTVLRLFEKNGYAEKNFFFEIFHTFGETQRSVSESNRNEVIKCYSPNCYALASCNVLPKKLQMKFMVDAV